MGAVLESFQFEWAQFEAELTAFGSLLASKDDLSETSDIQPFFKSNKQLSAFLGTYLPDVGPATELAFEFPFFGDYRADLLVGNGQAGVFCVVEFEDGATESIFMNQPRRANPEWSRRFEHGLSQLTDWFFNLDDYKKTHGFSKTFGYGHVSFKGLLLIGRLRWRSDKVLVDSNSIIALPSTMCMRSSRSVSRGSRMRFDTSNHQCRLPAATRESTATPIYNVPIADCVLTS